MKIFVGTLVACVLLCGLAANVAATTTAAAATTSHGTTQTPDPCNSNPCLNGGSCLSVDNINIICYCAIGFNGPTCANDNQNSTCVFGLCHNGGQCIQNSDTDFMCICPLGVYGTYCEYIAPTTAEINNPCLSSPCQNGGICSSTFDPNESAQTYTCDCQFGYYGTNCEFSSCLPNPCQNGGTCQIDFSNNYGFTCSCPTSSTGVFCETSTNNNGGVGSYTLNIFFSILNIFMNKSGM